MGLRTSIFASHTVGEHLLRGIAAAGLIALAVRLFAMAGLMGGGAAVLALVGAVFLLRGCPTCWLIGLFETVLRRHRRGRAGLG